MSTPHTVAVTGASGLVGRALIEQLEASGAEVRRLVRRPASKGSRDIHWNPATGAIDAAGLEGVEAVVHLAGENIANQRWTEEKKRRIVDSRVKGSELLAETLAGLDNKPAVLCSASAVGFYGDRGDAWVDEESPVGAGFLPETSRAWEGATRPAWEAGIRVVQTRIGLVLTPEGGVLAKLVPLFKWGLGGALGSGRQYMSWITRRDLIAVIQRVLSDPSLHGAVNAVSPNPVTNHDFTKALGRRLKRPTFATAPAFALRLATGQMADEALLASARVAPTRLLNAGFEFQDPELEPALNRLLPS